MTRRGGLVAGVRLVVGLTAAPLIVMTAGCGSGTSKYNAEGLSREDLKAPETPGKGAPPVDDPDDPRQRRRKKAAAE
jgi:hypothetical protein